MSIKIREQSGSDATRKFDYQMAVALDYLLSEIDNDVIVLIETLEDFAVFRDFESDSEKIDVFQVKTKDKGLYSKSMLLSHNVIGKIILTDFYFDSKANTLNIICNTSLKGASTEEHDSFVFVDKLTKNEMDNLKTNVMLYLKDQPDFSGKAEDYFGKLIYVKSALPFSEKEDRYTETLVGKTNSTIAHYLNDENHCINPQAVFSTLKLLIDKQRRNKFDSSKIEVKDALSKKGISTRQLKEVIEKAEQINHLSKADILRHASTVFTPKEYLLIKQEYPTFLACKANLTDRVYVNAQEIIEDEYHKQTAELDDLDEIVRQTAKNCVPKITWYPLPVIQILSIVTIYS